MQNIKAIIFDFGGVIFNIDYGKTSKAFQELGVMHFDDMYSQKRANPLFQHLEEGKINEEEFYNEFKKSTNSKLNNQQIEKAWNAMLLSFNNEALNTLQAIRSKYKLYLLSNTNIIHLKAFTKIYKEQIGKDFLQSYFENTYYSHEMGYRKPDKEAYEIVLKENNLNPSQTLFIDDSIQNIEGAKATGLQTVFLKDGMKIEDLNL
ncbi:MAG: HAD family phosphatase [Bacteroidota bacterium]|nr:HAD family phosphatase [Bacteroidota bacterium]